MKLAFGTPVVAVCLVVAAPAAAQECLLPPGHHVRVSDTGVVDVPPDRVSFSAAVETRDRSAPAALRANADKVRAVHAALAARGVAASALQTSHMDITRRNPDGSDANGFRVTNRVTVTTADPAGVGDLIEAALAAGGTEIGRLEFFVADRTGAESRARELAFAGARRKADALALLARRGVGDAICVFERGFEPREMLGVASTAGAPIQPGTEPVVVSVTAVFALRECRRQVEGAVDAGHARHRGGQSRAERSSDTALPQ